MTVGDRIKTAREGRDMTQEELGKICGVKKQTIFKYENNIITNIPLDKLKLISKGLKISVPKLMGWETEDGGVEMKFRIREARERAGYSQKELAQIIGVAQNTFHGYESGKHDPKPELLNKIADACNVTVDFLLGRDYSIESAPSEDFQEPDPLRSTLLRNFDQLNQEGQERLVETSDDMVSSGKYIKTSANQLGGKKLA